MNELERLRIDHVLGIEQRTAHGRRDEALARGIGLRRVGLRNLQMAMPEKTPRERRKIVRGVFRTLGRQLADFCQLPSYTRKNIDSLAVSLEPETKDPDRKRALQGLLNRRLGARSDRPELDRDLRRWLDRALSR